MRRRQFIALVGGAAAWPLAVRAQQARSIKRVGYLALGIGDFHADDDAFREGLRDFGYVEGQNVIIEYRTAGEKADELSDLAAELVTRKVDVIVAKGSQATSAARQRTTTIPIVTVTTNPVGLGFVESLAKSGGNVTGVSLLGPEVAGKRLELLKQLIPTLSRVAVIRHPDSPSMVFSVQETQAAAAILSLTVHILDVRTLDDFNKALEAAAKERCEAIVLLPNPLFVQSASQIAALAIDRHLPTLEFAKEPVKAGILMSYGADLVASVRRLAYFVDRILKGANPADLPVEQPTKFELVINLKTAKALGLAVPDKLLATADEVIE